MVILFKNSIRALKKSFCLPSAALLAVASLLFSAALSAAAELPGTQKPPFSTIKSVSYETDAASEKLILILDNEVSFKSACLDKSPSENMPFRLYIDILNTCLSQQIKRSLNPRSAFIKKIRLAEKQGRTARIVFELESSITRADYKIFHATDQTALIIEFPFKKNTGSAASSGKEQIQSLQIPQSIPEPAPEKQKAETMKEPAQQQEALLPSKPEIPGPQKNFQQESSRIPEARQPAREPAKKDADKCVIIIDPGHGGKDPGAIGYRGIEEKDVCLSIALELKKLLDRDPQCKTILTRTTDKFVTLAKRSKIANSNDADFFISIHTNSHDDEKLTGIETYYLNFSSDADARRVAARENFTSPAEISDLEMILFDLLQNEKINKSSILAGYIHNALVTTMKSRYSDVRNLGVKHAPLRVLIDAEMPCVIIEAAFISNPVEAKMLKTPEHQHLIAQAIVEGIRNFKSGVQAAFLKNTSKGM